MSGSAAVNQNGVYGSKAVANPANGPGARSIPVTWTDHSGNLWLFGGNGNSPGVGVPSIHFNDLWKFNPASNEWTWMSGGDAGGAGVYGTMGVAAPTNLPGSRAAAVGWTDAAGDLWLFGGWGYDSAGNFGTLNDLWKFDVQSLEWTWMGGSNTLPDNNDSCQAGVFGTKGAAAGGNVPSGHAFGVSWTDNDGNLWLFGGGSCDANGVQGLMNDLWKYSPSSNEWTWVSGASTTYQAGVYGTLGVASTGNVPGSRSSMTGGTDPDGNLWLFGGEGVDGAGIRGYMNDLWEFQPTSGEWMWVSGSSTVGTDNCYQQPGVECARSGVYGVLGQPAPGNVPGGRNSMAGAVDNSGNLWIFGGFNNPNGLVNDLNDLWRFNPRTAEWTWMSGSDTIDCIAKNSQGQCVIGGDLGVYGTILVPASGNVPGSRNGQVGWSNGDGNFWLFGGDGFGAAGSFGMLNDLWEYQVLQEPQAAAPVFSPGGGIYTSTQSVAMSDTTPGAAIYYTVDGSTPTTSSIPYSGAISISKTETIQAIAAASGYSQSAVASATYTINLPPPDFTLAATPGTLNLQSGQQGTIALSVTPQNGFNSTVSFACSGLPSDASCTFNPATVTPAGAASTTLTVTAETLSAERRTPRPYDETVLAFLVCVIGRKARARLRTLPFLAAVCIGIHLIAGCSVHMGAGRCTAPTPAPAVSTVTITASSGSIHETATFTLVVNPSAACY